MTLPDHSTTLVKVEKIEFLLAPEIHLYPIPATHVLKFNSDFLEIDKITIFNTIGQKIMEQNKKPVGNFIELKEMSRGIYYLRFQSSQHIVSKQFIIK